MDPQDSGGLEKLGRKLKDLKEQAAGRDARGAQMNRDAGMAGLGWRMSIELVVGIVVGLGMGYFLDRWLGTQPAFMIVFMFLGFGAGILNVVRLSARIQRQLQERDQQDKS